MKKILLISFVGLLFTAIGAYAHCGSCGVGDADHEHAAKAECSAEKMAECAKDKKCCGTDGKCCHAKAKKCCGTDGKCCKGEAKECTKECTKPCCAKEKKSDETAAAKPAGACCPAPKAGQPA